MGNNNGPAVFGWKDIRSAADEIYSGVNRRLLSGTPVFVYKSLTDKSNIRQLVVVRNIDYNTKKYTGTFGVGIITATWTATYPRVPYEFLSGNLKNDLKESKIEKEIFEIYDQIIIRLKENEK